MGKHREAIVLLGPTASGKTPLGQLLEIRGVGNRRCTHFDFGEHLRQVVMRGQSDRIVSVEDIQFLRGVLETGALLEDRDFPIAERVLQSFLQRREIDSRALIVLNGLPRHAGQAASLERLLEVVAVVLLQCSPETVIARIAANTGGDRTSRTDDDAPSVRRKLAVFDQRTAPLADYYYQRGARIIQLDVTDEMTDEQMWATLQSRF